MRRPGRSLLLAGGMFLWSLFASGCNFLDPIDTSLASRPINDRIAEGNIELDSGNFSRANEIFDGLYKDNNREYSVILGRGESLAGLGGFNLLTSMDIMQNGSGPYDKAKTAIATGRAITSRTMLTDGVTVLREIRQMNRPDAISRGLMAVALAGRLLLDKFDTNHDGRFTDADGINYHTNDSTTPLWPDVFRQLVSGGVAVAETLETASLDLIQGFEGTGTNWTFVTPVAGTSYPGLFTEANRTTILAVGDLVVRLQKANTYYEVNEASFTAAIRDLDGAEAP